MTLHVVLYRVAAGAEGSVALQKRTAREALVHSAELAGLPLAAIEELTTDERHAPVPSRGTCWTLTHTARWAGALAAPFPVGIDVERVRLPLERSREAILRSALAPRELTLLGLESHERVDARSWTLLWTAKEAALKATGLGLLGLAGCDLLEVNASPSSLPPAEVTARAVVSSAGSRFLVELREPDEEHLAAVAVPLRNEGDLPAWRVIHEVPEASFGPAR